MTSKYLFASLFITALVIIFSSCLGGSSKPTEVELSSDAQIYGLALTSKTDSNKVLPAVVFTIDQINKTIFNRDSLPYLFHADSINLVVRGKSAASFSKVVIKLNNPDSSYTWNQKDSVSLPRLSAIETTAADTKTVRLYQFTLSTHQQDPYLIQWNRMANNHLTPNSVQAQKSVQLGDKFFTYFQSGASIYAMSALTENATNWTSENLSGMPADIRLNSIVSLQSNRQYACYALNANNKLYKSLNGTHWGEISTTYPLVSIYGKLPSPDGSFAILTVVEDGGVKRYAKTADFSTFTLMNSIPENIPITDFASISIENPNTYSAKYILISGGKKTDATDNNHIWLLQENRDEIKRVEIPNEAGFDFQNNTLFWYDNSLYLFIRQEIVAENEEGESGNREGETYKNVLYTSSNYGMTWAKTDENQALPADFVDRTNTTIITDNKNFIWIFGGVSNSQQIAEVWRGRLNKLAID